MALKKCKGVSQRGFLDLKHYLSLEQPPGSSPFFGIFGSVPKVTENGTIFAILI